jgi:hypothetical protein
MNDLARNGIASACEVGQRHPTVRLGKRPFLSWRLTSENHERRTGIHERAMFSGQESSGP